MRKIVLFGDDAALKRMEESLRQFEKTKCETFMGNKGIPVQRIANYYRADDKEEGVILEYGMIPSLDGTKTGMELCVLTDSIYESEWERIAKIAGNLNWVYMIVPYKDDHICTKMLPINTDSSHLFFEEKYYLRKEREEYGVKTEGEIVNLVNRLLFSLHVNVSSFQEARRAIRAYNTLCDYDRRDVNQRIHLGEYWDRSTIL